MYPLGAGGGVRIGGGCRYQTTICVCLVAGVVVGCTKVLLNIKTLICSKIINGCFIIRITLLLGGILIYHSHTCYNMTSKLNLIPSNFWKPFFEAPYEVCALNDATLISFGSF